MTGQVNEQRKRGIFTFLIPAALLFALGLFALCAGKYPVSAAESLKIIFCRIAGKDPELPEMTVNVILKLRAPRILASILVGVALSSAGAAYQGVFMNPLVSPDFLGVSSGACIGAAAAILLSFSSALVSLFSFVGGIMAVLLTVLIPALLKKRGNLMLVLSGIIVSSLASSILGFLKYIADPDSQLASITYWTMGSFGYVKESDLAPLLIATVIPGTLLILMSFWIDVLSMGEREAEALGANVRLIRGLVILLATVLTAGSVCVSGTIGWVGLIVPHFSRRMCGPGNRRLIPLSMLNGAVFMLLIDTLSRMVGVSEMPVSIMTGLVGAPAFFFILWKQRRVRE